MSGRPFSFFIMLSRVGRVFRFDRHVFAEIERDPASYKEAWLVVFITGVTSSVIDFRGIFWFVLAAFLSWFFWSATIYFVGGKWLREPQTQTSLRELLNVLAYAGTPAWIRFLSFIPLFPGFPAFLYFVTALWIFVAMVRAIKESLDYESTGKALGVCVLGWLVQWIALWLISLLIVILLQPTFVQS